MHVPICPGLSHSCAKCRRNRFRWFFALWLLMLEIGIEEQLPKKITGWWYTYPSEKYEFVNGKDDIPYIMENNKCLKPPTRFTRSRFQWCGFPSSWNRIATLKDLHGFFAQKKRENAVDCKPLFQVDPVVMVSWIQSLCCEKFFEYGDLGRCLNWSNCCTKQDKQDKQGQLLSLKSQMCLLRSTPTIAQPCLLLILFGEFSSCLKVCCWG